MTESEKARKKAVKKQFKYFLKSLSIDELNAVLEKVIEEADANGLIEVSGKLRIHSPKSGQLQDIAAIKFDARDSGLFMSKPINYLEHILSIEIELLKKSKD